MWITLFTIVIGIALCFGLGAMAVESYDEKVRLFAGLSAKVKCQD